MVEPGLTPSPPPGRGSQNPRPDRGSQTPRPEPRTGGPGDEAPRASRLGSFGWRQGLALGAVVLVLVYAVAFLTALAPPLREALAALPITIIVLVVVTVGVLLTLALPRR